MNKNIALILRNFLVFALLSCSTGQMSFHDTTEQDNDLKTYTKPYVLLISIDGYRSDYTDLYEAENLKKFRDQGTAAEALIPIYPSKTFTNHYSIATGLYAENHGIVANTFYDPVRNETYALSNRKAVEDGSWYKGTPLWVSAEKQGMLAATFFWPGSEAAIQGIRPSYYYLFNSTIQNDFKIKQVMNWFNLPENKRPHFVTLYFPEVDKAGHHFGPRSEEVKKAVKSVDEALGKLFAKLKELPFPVHTVIVSDHGMQELDPTKIIYLDDLISLDGIKAFGDGPQGLLYFKDKTKIAQIEKALKRKEFPFDVYSKKNMPKRFRYSKDCPRCSDLVISVKAPYSLLVRGINPKAAKGNHGYDPVINPSMRGIFYAQGPQFKKSTTVKPFENVHIYPLLSQILGLEILTPIDGNLNSIQNVLENPTSLTHE